MAEYYVDERSRTTLQRVASTVRNQIGNSEFDPAGEVSASPSLYIAALADEEHLPAFDGELPGKQLCDIYKLIAKPDGSEPELEKVADARLNVWNFYRLPIFGTPLASRYWFSVRRDRYGRWLCERPCSLVAKNLGVAINGGSGGTVTIYIGAPGEEDTTGVTIAVFNRTGTQWANGKWGGVELVSGLVYGFPWECPPVE